MKRIVLGFVCGILAALVLQGYSQVTTKARRSVANIPAPSSGMPIMGVTPTGDFGLVNIDSRGKVQATLDDEEVGKIRLLVETVCARPEAKK